MSNIRNSWSERHTPFKDISRGMSADGTPVNQMSNPQWESSDYLFRYDQDYPAPEFLRVIGNLQIHLLENYTPAMAEVLPTLQAWQERVEDAVNNAGDLTTAESILVGFEMDEHNIMRLKVSIAAGLAQDIR